MIDSEITELLTQLESGSKTKDEVVELLTSPGFADLKHTKLDTDRNRRNGQPEVIFGEYKSEEQLIDITKAIVDRESPLLITRIGRSNGELLNRLYPEAIHCPVSKTISYRPESSPQMDGTVAIITAGTSDLGTALEAKITVETMGYRAELIEDVGVAGIHRLFNKLPEIERADVVIAVAGMEGALASVLGGLISSPIIAVPTSIGYGANLQGITTLLSMLTSCSSGITVVNIDNGYGAAAAAVRILGKRIK